MLEVLDADYVRTARAKGLPERRSSWKHTLKNAAMPIVTVIGLQFGLLLGGAIVCEMIFSWPGVGRLMIFAIYNRDFPLVEAAVFVMAMVFILANLLVDLCYAWLDPRVKLKPDAPRGAPLAPGRGCRWSPRSSARCWRPSSPPTTRRGAISPRGCSRRPGPRRAARGTCSAPTSSGGTS